MIKIIKRGTIKRFQTCEFCGCKFSYEYEDIKNICGTGCHITVIKCPQCNIGNILSCF